MLKTTAQKIVFGCALGLLVGLLVSAFESDFRGQICEYDQATKNEYCTTYSFLPFLLIQVFKTLNDLGAAITALATVIIAVFTGTLWFSTNKQARLTRESIDLARDEFISTHKPKIVIREPRLGESQANPVGDKFSIVTYTVENCGNSDAEIVNAAIEASCAIPMGYPVQTQLTEQSRDIEPITIVPGGYVQLVYKSNLPAGTSLFPESNGDTCLYFYGKISFKDRIGTIRITAFCRRFNVHRNRFCLIPDCEDEYG
jgi:hypothetical protein